MTVKSWARILDVPGGKLYQSPTHNHGADKGHLTRDKSSCIMRRSSSRLMIATSVSSSILHASPPGTSRHEWTPVSFQPP